MIAIHESVGRLVALANLEKDLFAQKSIEQSIADLVDLITLRVKVQPVEDVANGLLEHVFDLRFDLLEWLTHRDKSISFYLDSLNKHISANLQLAPYYELAETVAVVLSAYKTIVSPLLESLPHSFEDILSRSQKPQYATFALFALHPSPQVRAVKDWLDASLKLEVGLILSDLLLSEQIKLPKKRIKAELIAFLHQTITRFGAYSVFTGFWSPAVGDTSNLTNRMKILAATLELDNKSFYKTSKVDGSLNRNPYSSSSLWQLLQI